LSYMAPHQQLPLAIPLSTLETTQSLGKHGLVNVSTPPPTPGTHNIFPEAPRMALLSFSAAADFAHGVVQGRPQSRARRPSRNRPACRNQTRSVLTSDPAPTTRLIAPAPTLVVFRHSALRTCTTGTNFQPPTPPRHSAFRLVVGAVYG
jgi:hypothetical protein